MSEEIVTGKPLTDEHKRLIQFFSEGKKNEITLINEAGKRIIELCTGMLGLIFTIAAFGKDFPPAYLVGNLWLQILIVAVLIGFSFSIFAGLVTIQPRFYAYGESNLSSMRDGYKDLLGKKACWMQIANWAFFISILLFAVLSGVIILTIYLSP